MIAHNIRTLNIFASCDTTFFDRLEKQMQILDCKKGLLLFVQGDTADRFYYVESGWVKLFRETLDGEQAVIDIIPAGHIFSETSIFEDGKHPYSAEIVKSGKILSLPLNVLKSEIENNNKLALSMLGSMARYRRQQSQELEHMAIQNAPQRIGCFILRLANQSRNGKITIHLPYDKTLIASRLGMQPETFSRALAKLKKETGIRIDGATITMDSLDQLIHYSCAVCSSEFPCSDLNCKS